MLPASCGLFDGFRSFTLLLALLLAKLEEGMGIVVNSLVCLLPTSSPD